MKTFLLLCFSICSLAATAKGEKYINYSVTYEADATVGATEGKVKITCAFDAEYDPQSYHSLRYGFNGTDQTGQLSQEANELIVDIAPGNYVGQFFYTNRFSEIETDSIEVKPGQLTVIHLYFHEHYSQIKLKKPVIYLYPETEQTVSITLESAGALTFTYPELANGWSFTASTDGTLRGNDGKIYPYLFWEADYQPELSARQEGFIVQQQDAVVFLEVQLTHMGFNDRERTDFITFWGPQLAANERSFVHFVWNDACDAYAKLAITPQPDHVNRLYMLWSAVDAATPEPKPQQLPVFDRSGFDVLEWGGMEVPSGFTAETQSSICK